MAEWGRETLVYTETFNSIGRYLLDIIGSAQWGEGPNKKDALRIQTFNSIGSHLIALFVWEARHGEFFLYFCFIRVEELSKFDAII